MFSKSASNAATGPGDVSDRKKTVANPSNPKIPSVPSLLGRDLSITGDVKTDGEIQIDGHLEGNLDAVSVTIGEHGSVSGSITGQTVHVRGKVTGRIDANSIELSETANVQADLVQDQLMIANGAFFDGKCARKTTAPTPLKTTQKSA
ncbi:polymer-forming cytoskeletal protein [Algimonas porphyrae]|uniref:Polymer-forming cytoskeletal protein n=1 Tax=Algimonas porphyrae TaxID=1128113 RepID=A0ABQ5UWF8_9PROT|nr:polymer-forming cytoskeletal protein [Algimonas porphyrae]GLQ19239.1 hypothetical protein GCM10007854_01940 [Algimonas porphyrae]